MMDNTKICSADETLKQMVSAITGLTVLTNSTLVSIIIHLSLKQRKDLMKDRAGIGIKTSKSKVQNDRGETQIRMEGVPSGTP